MTDDNPLALLVLGGTSWLGGAVAAEALSRGHRVACLARGEAGEPPAGVTWVRSDRGTPTAYDEVAAHDWDAVLEVSWQPDFVRAALVALALRTRHWVYVSSCSVYADDDVPDAAEDAPTLEPHEGTGPVDVDVYGPAKVACELACLAALGPERVTVARAGLIGGYGDSSDRFGYWPARVARALDGAPVLVPLRGLPVQVVDVADLAAWLVRCAERRTAGVFNAVGDPHSFRELLECCSTATGRSPRLVEAPDQWLGERGVHPWAGPESLPLWLPHPQHAGFMTRRNDAARTTGLEPRPLLGTVEAALCWECEQGVDRDRQAGLTPAREARLVAALLAAAASTG